jgi:hypothetical protein
VAEWHSVDAIAADDYRDAAERKGGKTGALIFWNTTG